jgi:hypothetical protein
MAEVAKPPIEVKKIVSVLEQLKKLDEQRAKLLEGAKTEAVKKAEEAVAELNELGFSYRLVEGEAKAGKKRVSSGVPRQKSETCQICKFSTDPIHDGRLKLHRDQGEHKKPLTDKQLTELNMKKKA